MSGAGERQDQRRAALARAKDYGTIMVAAGGIGSGGGGHRTGSREQPGGGGVAVHAAVSEE